MKYKTVYRFLTAEGGLKSIEGNNLRVGHLKELNDPFEWRFGLKNQSGSAIEGDLLRLCLERWTQHLHDKNGLICFTDSPSDPLFWAHYADSHRGIALECDHHLDGNIEEVEYLETRPVLDTASLADPERKSENEELLRESLICKSPSWRYEHEWRAFQELSGCEASGGMYFREIPEDFLKKVILGARCPYSEGYIRKALDSSGHSDVKVVRAELDLLTYNINC